MERLVFILAILLPANALSAVAIDTTSSGEGTTSTSHSHTFAAGSIAIICTGMRAPDGTVTAISTPPTVGGSNATFLIGQSETGTGAMRMEMWYHKTPGTGSKTVAATYDASTSKALTHVISLTGVDTGASTFNTAASAFNSSANADVNSIASAVSELGIACVVGRTNTTTFSADATSPVSTEQSEVSHTQASSFTSAIYSEAGASGTIDMRVDPSASVQWAMVAVSVREAAGAGSSRRRYGALYLP